MRVTIIGAGAGGAAAVAELSLAGHDITLWNRSAATLEPLQQIGGVEYEGVLGAGFARVSCITTDLGLALEDTDAVLCTLPTFSHAPVAIALADAGISPTTPVILNPGHTGGALEFATAFRTRRSDLPPVCEFSTLTYVARKYEPHKVTVTGRAQRVRAAALPGGAAALTVASTLYPAASAVSDVLACGLCNANLVLHPPGAILGAAWVEATHGDYTFYAEGMTPGVARVMKALDDERRAVARAFGHELPNLIEEMQGIGTVSAAVTDINDYAAAIAAGEANRRIKAPDSLAHRYYLEDFGHGVLPFMELASIAGVPVPVAHSLYTLAESLVGTSYAARGRTAAAMGIAGMTREALMASVRA